MPKLQMRNSGWEIAGMGGGPSLMLVTDSTLKRLDYEQFIRNLIKKGAEYRQVSLPRQIKIVCWSDISTKKDSSGEEIEDVDFENSSENLEQKRKDYVEKIIAETQPERIVFCGIKPAKVYFANDLGLQPSQYIHRVHLKKISARTYPCGVVPSLYWLAHDDGIASNITKVELIQDTYETLGIVLAGNNLYTLKAKHNLIMVKTPKDFDSLMTQLRKAKVIAIDTETKNLSRINNPLASIQFCMDGLNGYFLPCSHPESPWTPSQLKHIYAQLKRYFEEGTSDCHVYINPKFDLIRIFVEMGVRFYNHRVYDCQAGEFALNENRRARKFIQVPGYALEQICLEYGSTDYRTDAGSMGKNERQDVMSVNLDRLAKYSVKDVVYPWAIYYFQLAEFKRRGSDYAKCEMLLKEQISDMILVMARMEANGVPVDTKYLMDQMMEDGYFKVKLRETVAKIAVLPSVKKTEQLLAGENTVMKQGLFGPIVGANFDINKDKFRQTLFFKVLKLDKEPGGYTKAAGGRVGKAFQNAYKDIPEVALFNAYQNAAKMYNTYIVGFYKKLQDDPSMVDKRMRPSFMFLPIVTGRAAAQKPSLMQIPSRGADAKYIKRQFIGINGCLLLKVDFNAHEVRNWSIESGDQVLANSFKIGYRTRIEYRLNEKLSKLLSEISQIKDEIAKRKK